MAIISVDLGTSDQVITDTDGAETTFVNISALGSHTLTIDGANVELQSIANVTALSNPTFNTINGAELTVRLGVLDISALSSFTFGVGDTSTVVIDASTVTTVASLLNAYNVVYSGSEAGNFVYDPSVSLLSTVVFNVSGMAAGDSLSITGISNNLSISSYDQNNQTLTLHYGSYTGLLVQSVWVDVSGVTPEDYAAITASLNDSDPSNDLITADTFTFPSTNVICFTRGTRLETPRGSIPIEELTEGELVHTLDHGPQPIRWIGSVKITSDQLQLSEKIRPIRIQAGALGRGVPQTDLVVSPQHRLLIRSPIAQRMFGEPEVLLSAKMLLRADGIEIVQELEEVWYFHILFDRHEVLIANGTAAESLYTGPMALQALSPKAQAEIFRLFPTFREQGRMPPPARPLISGRQARQLTARHLKNDKAFVADRHIGHDAEKASVA